MVACSQLVYFKMITLSEKTFIVFAVRSIILEIFTSN